MSNKVQFGASSWDEEIKQSNQNQTKDSYMRLESGSNVIRCVTKPYRYQVHSFKENKDDTGYGDKIMCSAHHKSCPVCELGDKAKRRWFVGVIDRKTQSYKILDIGAQVFKSIQEFSRDEDYGEPGKYDIDIKVDKKGGPTGYYTVIPKPPKSLSEADIRVKDEQADVERLAMKVTPPTPERVQEILDGIRAKKAAKQSHSAPVTSSKNASHAASTEEVAPEEDASQFEFPSVN